MSRTPRLLVAAMALAAALAVVPRASAQLVADLSSHLVAITTGFTGTDVLLFGATEGKGDVVVVVRGPQRREVVRRMDRVAGIWVNSDEMVFESVPSYYRVASSRPLDEVVPEASAQRHRIGVDNLRLAAAVAADDASVRQFRAALVRNKQRASLFGVAVGSVTFLGNRLFRTNVTFPANAPVGVYEIQVYLFQEGEVTSASITPLVVSRVGFEAGVFDFAHRHALAYGVLAVLIAVVAGWAAGIIFRKT